MASDRNPNISREQSVRFTAPAQRTGAEAIAAGVEGVALAGAEFAQQKLTNRLEDELMQAQDEALAQVQAKIQAPESEGGTGGLTEGEAMSLQEFTDRMADLQSAANQGTSTMTQLKIKQEQILRDYMSRYPALRPRFQQAAQGVLGYSPIGAQVRAAEAAEQAAGGAGMPPIMSLMMNQAVQAGVDATLLVRNPTEFWAQAQHKLALRQQVTTTDQALAHLKGQADLQVLTSQPEWAQFTASMSELMWGEELRPVIDQFYNDLQLTPDMSPSQRASRIEAAISDGRYRDMQLGLQQEKERWLADMYERYQGSIGTVNVNGQRISAMTYEQFRERTQPIQDQYNWAIANLGDPKAMEAMEMFNKARSARIISGMPDDLVTLSEIGKLFGADNTFSQILTQGKIGDTAAVIVSDLVIRMFGGVGVGGEGGPGSGGVRPPNGQPGVVPQVSPAKARLMTVDEVVSYLGVSTGDADEALTQINQRLGNEWLNAYEETGDATYAVGVWTLAKEYGNAIEYAYTQGGSMPSEETDNIMINIVADPRFAKAALAGTKGYTTEQRIQAMDDLVMNMRRRGGEVLDEAFGVIATNLDRDDVRTRPGRPGAGGVQHLQHQVANYVDINLDPEGYTLSFTVKDNVPAYQVQALENLVKRLNSDLSAAEQELVVKTIMGTAHTRGFTGQRAYEYLTRSAFGIEQ